MITLGIETTAHTFGVGIVKDKKILANERVCFTTESGGMLPREVAEHHVEKFDTVILNALEKAKINFKDLDLVAFSQGPGIGNMLGIGAKAARSISLLHNIPIIGVNHCIAHLEIGKFLTKAKNPVLLYASGANTQVIAFEGGKYRIFGETLDQGVGNFLDSFARFMGLGFPGGPKLYELSLKAKNFIELPYVVKGMDVSFAGLLTNLKQKYSSGEFSKEDLSHSLQETAFAMLIEVSERAMAHCDKKELLLGGGVACNLRLQDMAKKMCKDRNAECFILESQYNIDNGAMIAVLGQKEFLEGRHQELHDTGIKAYMRTDD